MTYNTFRTWIVIRAPFIDRSSIMNDGGKMQYQFAILQTMANNYTIYLFYFCVFIVGIHPRVYEKFLQISSHW